MLLALLAKNKLGFINGTCKKEDLGPFLHHLWDHYNAFVFAWTMNSVSKDLLSNIIYSTSALLVWTELKERFDKVNNSRIFQLYHDISFIQQGLDTIHLHFGWLKLLWDEFAAVSNLPNCGCEKYKLHVEHQNNIKLFQFLMGLNETYENVKSNLILIRVSLSSLKWNICGSCSRRRSKGNIFTK